MNRKHIWKMKDGSTHVYVGNNKEAKQAFTAFAQSLGYDVVDMVDVLAIEHSERSKAIAEMNESLKGTHLKAVSANTVFSSALKDYLEQYAEMTDSEELREYLGKMEEFEDEDAHKAAHSLKDMVEDAEKKAVAREVTQEDLDYVSKRMGTGLLKHAIFNIEKTDKKKAHALKLALLNAFKNAGINLIDFAIWASSDEAALIADELNSQLPNIPLNKTVELGNAARNLFQDSMVDYIGHMNKKEYLSLTNYWEQLIGTQSKPAKTSIIKKIKHAFK